MKNVVKLEKPVIFHVWKSGIGVKVTHASLINGDVVLGEIRKVSMPYVNYQGELVTETFRPCVSRYNKSDMTSCRKDEVGLFDKIAVFVYKCLR